MNLNLRIEPFFNFALATGCLIGAMIADPGTVWFVAALLFMSIGSVATSTQSVLAKQEARLAKLERMLSELVSSSSLAVGEQ